MEANNLPGELCRTLAAGPPTFGPRALLAWLRAIIAQPDRPDRTWYEITASGQLIRL